MSWTTRAPSRPVSGTFVQKDMRYNVIVQIRTRKKFEVRQVIHNNNKKA